MVFPIKVSRVPNNLQVSAVQANKLVVLVLCFNGIKLQTVHIGQ